MNRMRRNAAGLFWGICLTLAACGGTEEPNIASGTVQSVGFDWKTEGFAVSGTEEEALLFETNCEKLAYDRPNSTVFAECVQREKEDTFFLFDKLYTSQETIYRFYRLDAEETRPKEIALCPDAWGIPDGDILGMSVVDSEQCVFYVKESAKETGETEHYYAVSADSGGNLLKSVDIIDFLKERGIWEKNGYAGSDIDCDGQGNLYIRDQDGNAVFVLDSDGRPVAGQVFRPGSVLYSLQSFLTADGDVIFVFGWEERTEFIWMNPENGAVKQLAQTDPERVAKWYGLKENILYYATDKQLVGWNIATGGKEILYELEENGIAANTEICFLRSKDGGKMIVTEKEKRYLYTFSEEKPVISAQLTFVNACVENSFLQGRLIAFSRENPQYTVEYTDASRTEEDINRVLMAAVNGEGPDVLYVLREDMERLQAQDGLGELGLLLPEETLEFILPGAVDMGTCDGQLVGLPLSVSARTMLVSRDYWEQDTWTAEDVLKILNGQESPEGIFVDVFGQDNYFYNMYFLLGIDIRNTNYMKDGEKGFDSQEFRDLLTAVKQKTNDRNVMDSIGALRDGDYLGAEYFVFDMAGFCSMCSKAGESVFPVGYPVETGRGHFVEAEGMIVVSRNAMEKEGVGELVEYLFGRECQQQIKKGISVRLDIPESQLIYNEDRKKYVWVYPDGEGVLLPERQDGSSYLEEYVNFLKGTVACSADADEIFRLVQEEADSYFYSDKELDEVMKAIQSRVGIYIQTER